MTVAHKRQSTGRVLLVVNEDASRVTTRDRDAVIEALGGPGSVELAAPGMADDATAICREAAARGHHLVVAYGGDGTVSAAARGLIGSGVPLACIPGGYTNVVARTLGAPRDPVAAARRIATRPPELVERSVALGTIDGRPFLFAFGAGFSAGLIERVEAGGSLKAGLGSVYAAGQVVAEAARVMAGEGPTMTIDAGGREVPAVAAIAQNSDPLTFLGPRPIRISPDAGLEQTGLALAALRSARVRDVARLTAGALSGRSESVVSHPQLAHWPAVREARITSLHPDGVAIEADGDFLGRRPVVELGIAPEKLLLLA